MQESVKAMGLFCGFSSSMHLYAYPLYNLISMYKKCFFLVVAMVSLCSFPGMSQKKTVAKYPSLFWEITGNGLKKPSYLFGTMHVSSKLVFHLSDSFYIAIRNVDAVALELNPDLWQPQMVSMDKLKANYTNFTQVPGGDYLNENSFRIHKYDDELKGAMSTEPTVMNSLLYRTYKSREDFEEDTFLDLYIFQTGRKLGKRAAGVEDYFESEKLVLEAYTDMAREKKKKTIDMDGESGRDIGEKLQDAYRKGDLDLMDSLDKKMDRSDAFREKFLYKRNEIQANSMDTIMQKSSLFVGVGAAHLAGERGVIELLRKKGYSLRPILMADMDATQKESIDKMKVPVNFATRYSDDGLFSVDVPGPLFDLVNDNQGSDRRQYADMSNGSYYLVTRVKTHAAFLGQNENMVMKKVDSVLYENIPGKILSKKLITTNGYSGYDITSRTRRGDMQRYNIFVTPFEVLLFKMSGNENYVDGDEANRFFSSIHFAVRAPNGSEAFQPKQGGFSIRFPQAPNVYLNTDATDDINRWEYEAVDKTTGDAYLVFKKSVNNFRFLEVDSFDLGLVEESFRNPDYFEKQLYRKQSAVNGYPCLDVTEKMKDGTEVKARFIIKGPHYYVLAVKSKNKKNDAKAFFDSFRFTPYNYNSSTNYVDTFMHFTVSTPVFPQLDGDLRRLTEQAGNDAGNGNNYSGYISYWPKAKNGLFKNDSTGEVIGVSVQEYPKYYYVKDTARSFKNEMDNFLRNDMVLYKSDSFFLNNGLSGYRFTLRDTGSSRTINRAIMFKGNYRYSMVCLGDTLAAQSGFINDFFNSFAPDEKKNVHGIYNNKLEDFFTDLFSKDSTVRTKARQSISSIYYGEKGVSMIMDAIGKLNISDKDYFETKTKLIAELGYIKDTARQEVVAHLKKIYEQAADTSLFQNEVYRSLARHKTTAAYALLKSMMLQDPPIFENSYDYSSLFSTLDDSLQLSKELYPDLLQLSTMDDYKSKVFSLLVTLVDSNFIKASDYESYFSKIYYDARIELKKQQAKDEKKMEQENKKDDNNNLLRYTNYSSYSNNRSGLNDYGVLLLPFYDKNANVQKYFEKLLRSKDADVRLNTAVLLIRNKRNVADSILLQLAETDQYRAKLFAKLEKVKRVDKFPLKYKHQLDMARSLLLDDRGYDKVDSVVFIKKQVTGYRDKKGVVYFFKYRVKKEDDWKTGISGLQPEDETAVGSDDHLTSMTDKKLKEDEPMDEQLQKLLKKLLFSLSRSGKYFFTTSNYYERMRRGNSYGDE